MTSGSSVAPEGVQGGSSVDPRTWVAAHGDALFRYAMLRLRDREAAEEVVQECFLGALGARNRFSEESAERTWLIGILRHKIVDRIRGQQGERDRSAGVDASEPEFFDRRGLWRTGPRRWAQDPTAAMQRDEFWLVLRGCLERLPTGLHRAFLLRELDEMDSKETCEVLGVSSASLWQRLHRARLMLRECLELNWFRPPENREKVIL